MGDSRRQNLHYFWWQRNFLVRCPQMSEQSIRKWKRSQTVFLFQTIKWITYADCCEAAVIIPFLENPQENKKEMSIRVLFVRHGESQANTKHWLGRVSYSPLTSLGEQQAKALGDLWNQRGMLCQCTGFWTFRLEVWLRFCLYCWKGQEYCLPFLPRRSLLHHWRH